MQQQLEELNLQIEQQRRTEEAAVGGQPQVDQQDFASSGCGSWTYATD